MMRTGFGMAFPETVAFAQLSRGDEQDWPLYPEEESLLHPRSITSRRLDFHLGRAAARQALVRLGRSPAPILIGDQRQPLWPEGIVGSITHATGVAMAVASDRTNCGGLGIDVENAGRTFDELDQHVAFAEEREFLEALPAEQRRLRSLELFSAKESVFKAFFPRVGRVFGFETALLRPRPDGGYEGRLKADLDGEYPRQRTFTVHCQWQGDLVMTSLVLPP